MADVFLIYAPADAELALRVSKGLERAGLSVTRGPTQYAADWAVRVFDALDASSATVALWSRDAMLRDWMGPEAAIGAHFGQLVSIRVDPALPRDQIPAAYREADGSVTDIFESDIAPNGWNQSATEALDRSLAPVSGKIRALKARGPVAAPIAEAGAVAPADEVQRRLSAHFAYTRRDGVDKAGRSLPALAATRREAAFRAAYETLETIDFPADIRAALIDFSEPESAPRGIARLYAEALSRNDRDFWGHLGRLATPLSASLALAALLRSGAPAAVINELLDPRDPREVHAERYGRVKGARKAAGSPGGVVLWPMAAVAVGVAALVAMPQLSRFFTAPPTTPTETAALQYEDQTQIASSSQYVEPAPERVIAPIPPTEDRVQVAENAIDTPPATDGTIPIAPLPPPRSTTVTAIDSQPKAPATTQVAVNTPPVAPPTTPPPVAQPAPQPAPVQTAQLPFPTQPAPLTPPVGGQFQNASVSESLLREPVKLRYCRLAPGPAEYTVEVLPSEGLFDVAERVALGSREGMRLIARRNSGCLDARALAITGGGALSGADLIFPGDRLVIPAVPILDQATAQDPTPPT